MEVTPPASVSLSDVHASVGTDAPGFWKRLFAFAGPAYLISVGYMDPGNWATDLEGGARFGYRLLWVLILSNAMAVLLQTLSARLGIVAQTDLAQACRKTYPRWATIPLWILCEIAIAACDLAEILGAAIGLKLLFGIPLLAGVAITAADTILLLWLNRLGMRAMEAFVLSLIAAMAGCFVVELLMAKPVWTQVLGGVVPRIDRSTLYVAIGILGATVMPHNLYLHSALVQTRRIGTSVPEKREACWYNFLDSAIALNGAMFVNCAILVLAASVFFTRGIAVTQIEQAQVMLTPLLGTGAASALFAIALLCSGQSSTLTGTMAGQVVMEGFLNFRIQPWLRRAITRLVALIPAVVTIWNSGEAATYQLIILSQVILSLQLPFAIIPLIHFTSDSKRMGELVNPVWVRVLGWSCAALIICLNFWLAYNTLNEWSVGAGSWFWPTVIPITAAVLCLLAFVAAEPWLPASLRGKALIAGQSLDLPLAVPPIAEPPVYNRILVSLDHTARDYEAVGHAVAMAQLHHATIYLVHVEEGVTSQLFGPLSSTAEVEFGRQYFNKIAESIEQKGIHVELAIVHGKSPAKAIVEHARSVKPDLVVMAAHGHRGWKDIVFGTTISAVRHGIRAPLLVVAGK
jgi:manganese transport protein